jgi:hypothetical protein
MQISAFFAVITYKNENNEMKILNNAKYIRSQQNLWKLCGEIH